VRIPQARPDLPVTVSDENRLGEKLANLAYEFLVGVHLRTAFARRSRLQLALPS
jgi:hypothetical protein